MADRAGPGRAGPAAGYRVAAWAGAEVERRRQPGSVTRSTGRVPAAAGVGDPSTGRVPVATLIAIVPATHGEVEHAVTRPAWPGRFPRTG